MNLLLRFSFCVAFFAVGFFSLLPAEHLPSVAFDWWDKAQHALAFMVLGSLGLLAYSSKSSNVFLVC